MENMIVNTIENILDESVTLQTKVDDINAWTSLKMLQIIMALEDEGSSSRLRKWLKYTVFPTLSI